MTGLLKYTGGLITKDAYGETDIGRTVKGYYTSNTVDLHGHIIDKNAMLAALDSYREWNTVRLMHETPIGVAKSIGTPEWNFIEAEIANTTHGNEVLQLIDQGVYKAFSVGILVTNGEFVPFTQLKSEDFVGLPLNLLELFREMGDVFKITGLTLVEVSVVDRPANPMARVQAVQNELGGQYGSILPIPSLGVQSGIETIKSVIRSSGLYVPVTASMKEVFEVNKEETIVETELMQDKVQDTTGEGDADVEALTTQDAVDQVIESDKQLDNLPDALNRIEAAVEKFATQMDELKGMLDAVTTAVKSFDVEAIGKYVVANLPQPQATEEKTEATAITEEQIKSIVGQVVTGLSEMKSQRKGVVNVDDGDEVAEVVKPDLKSMSASQLSALIVQAAIARN